MAVSALFLVEIAAPRLLRLPYHHCPYDLLPRVPESVVMMGLFAAGFFAVGWAWVAGCWAEDDEGGSRQAKVIQPLLDLAWIGYLGAADLRWDLIVAFGGLMIAGILGGSALAPRVPQAALKRAFAVLLLLVGSGIIWQYASL